MTCQELRQNFEGPLRMDAGGGVEAEHLANCAECARFVELRCELVAGLRLVRESAPELPAALEDAVLTKYRSQLAGPRPASSFTPWRRRLAATFAAAALTVVAALAFHPKPRTDTSVARVQTAQVVSVPQRPTAINIPKIARSRPISSHPARRERVVQPLPAGNSPASADFRGLMYCDPLSCGGAMQLIRVQLPSFAVALAPSEATSNGVVYADVLVGSDGIARGIRVVQ